MKTVEQHWTEKVGTALVGRRIKAVFYDGAEYWGQMGINLELDDGTIVLIQSDEEGNGPGAVIIERQGKIIYGPILRDTDSKTIYKGAHA